MNTKLTLRMDKSLIASAKKYSEKTGKTVSKIVADYFEILKNNKPDADYPISPTVKRLKGVLKGSALEETDYKKHLEKKYL